MFCRRKYSAVAGLVSTAAPRSTTALHPHPHPHPSEGGHWGAGGGSSTRCQRRGRRGRRGGAASPPFHTSAGGGGSPCHRHAGGEEKKVNGLTISEYEAIHFEHVWDLPTNWRPPVDRVSDSKLFARSHPFLCIPPPCHSVDGVTRATPFSGTWLRRSTLGTNWMTRLSKPTGACTARWVRLVPEAFVHAHSPRSSL